MKVKKNTNRLKQFQSRYFSSKAGILLVVNHKLKGFFGTDNQFGKLTDLELRRQEKTIILEVTDGEDVNNIAICNYGFENRKGDPYLTWKSIDFEGPAEDKYKRIFRDLDGVLLSKKYFSLVEAML